MSAETKRVVVTGCAGFIGSHLAENCLARGWEVTGVDCLTPYYDPQIKRANVATAASHPSFTFLESHLLELDLDELFEGVDIVFHLAAQAGVRASWGQSFETYTELNVTTLQRLLEAARKAAIERFVAEVKAGTFPAPEHSF